MKKEIREILKKLLSGKQHIKIADLQILMKALFGKSAQYGFEAADIIERELNDGRINEEDALLLIEAMLDDDNNDRQSGGLGLVDLTPNRINPIRVPDYDIAVAYGVQVYPGSDTAWNSISGHCVDNATTAQVSENNSISSAISYNGCDVQFTANAASHVLDEQAGRKLKYGISGLNKVETNEYNPFYGEKGKKKVKTKTVKKEKE